VTFQPPVLQSITLVPLDSDDASGRFRIWLTVNEEGPPILVWDRKVEGQFPELKHLVSFPRFYGNFLKRETWALRRNSEFGIMSSQIGRLAIQTNEIETGGR
jgi:Rdx family protein